MENGVLPVRGALRLVEHALLDVIGLAYLKRGPVAADTAALAAMASLGASGTGALTEGDLRFVTAAGKCYVWRGAAAGGAGSVQPTDRVVTGKPGRWLPTNSSILAPDGTPISAVPTGYLRAVQLYQGETDRSDWEQRILARRPASLIQYAGHSDEQKSNLRGALKLRYYHFEIWAISFNARPLYEAALGSPVTTEVATDPGVETIAEDLEDLLDGLTGAQLATDGIDHLRLHEWKILREEASRDLSQRLFIWAASLDVRTTVGKEDRPTRYTLDEIHATGVDPTDGVTPVTPQSQIFP